MFTSHLRILKLQSLNYQGFNFRPTAHPSGSSDYSMVFGLHNTSVTAASILFWYPSVHALIFFSFMEQLRMKLGFWKEVSINKPEIIQELRGF